jgi:adenine-specific DNA-methyltransferase
MFDDPISLPDDIETHGVKYLGSKKKIVENIGWFLRDLDVTSAIDVFSGTTRVAQYLRQRGIKMTTSDLAWATTCYAHTYVHNQNNRHLKDRVASMNNLAPSRGWLSENYTGDTDQTAERGEGRCFQLKNTMKADAARDWIETQGDLALWEKMTLITSVINALDAVDNTVGVQQAYLKEWCARSSNDIVFKLPPCIRGPVGQHFEGDALTIEYPATDLAYLDPPYSPHSYATYYHIWDSIAKWDKPATTLKARRRVDRVANHADFNDSMDSPWNHAKQAVAAFDKLIGRLPVRYVMISYNDESIVSEIELEEVCRRHGKIQKNLIDYKRNIMSQVGNAAKDGRSVQKNQMNSEILFLIEKC